MKEIELIEKRRSREKHFLREDGTFIAKIYDNDIHFYKNGKYEEIDNSLIKENGYYVNKNNSFKVKFKELSENELMSIESNGHFMNFNLINANVKEVIKEEKNSKINNDIKYHEIFSDIDLEYKVLPKKIKESIILKNKNNIPQEFNFEITTDLELLVNQDRSISAFKNENLYYKIDAPYMVDSEGKINKNIFYILKKNNERYNLTLILDVEWLKREDIVFPVIIDPTIIDSEESNTLDDTYIFPGDSGVNKGSLPYIKTGVERINNNNVINRGLLKFNLPVLNTGDQILYAELNMIGYVLDDGQPSYPSLVNIHQMLCNWTEQDAKWDNLNDKYNSKIETSFYAQRSQYYNNAIDPVLNIANITNLVRKWYTDTPNYGLMVKADKEEYQSHVATPMFYSKNHNITNYDAKPLLTITYRNQNGLESYINCKQQIFKNASTYANTYNGNMTAVFDLGEIPGSRMQTNLKLVYNTNDVLMQNNYGYGNGYKLNIIQTIENYNIGSIEYRKYIDSDGTAHYFQVLNGEYINDDGIGLILTYENSRYILKDKNDITMIFTPSSNNKYYLTTIKDSEGNEVIITYNSDNKVVKITDSNTKVININYYENNMKIISDSDTTTVNFTNGKIVSIKNKITNTFLGYNSDNLITRITDEANDVIYEYYGIRPYKIKKITQYGMLDTEGNHLEFEYGFNSTTISDNKKSKTIIYDAYGNISSVSTLKSNSSLKDAYSIRQVNGTNGSVKNKLISTGIPIKYVKNYLKNVSFETEEMYFDSSSSMVKTMTNEFAYSGSKSLKITSTQNNDFIRQDINVAKGSKYTFSAYIKNNVKSMISLFYTNVDGSIMEEKSEVIQPNNLFERYDVTIDYPLSANSKLGIKIYTIEAGTIFIDDIQLEDGEVVNNFNILENSDFSDGLNGWDVRVSEFETGNSENLNVNDYFQPVVINDESALKINMYPSLSTDLSKNITLSGKAGDIYNISFWYKNNGTTPSTDFSYNCVIINFANTEYNEYGHCVLPSTPLNPNDDNWQYFSYNFKAEYDYTGLSVAFLQSENANNLYLTDICLFKDISEGEYIYDEEGKIVEIKDYNNMSEHIDYNENKQISRIKDKNNNDYNIEYDYYIKTRPLNTKSPSGLIEENIYDDNGNVVTAKTKSTNLEIESNNIYAIRAKGTSKYIRCVNNIITLDEYSNDGWKIKEENSGFYSMAHPIINDLYISALSYAVYAGTSGYYSSQFILIDSGNGSYKIRLSTYNKYIKNDFGHLTVTDYIDGDESFEFYFEKVEDSEFIETNATYDQSGRFIKTIEDSGLNEKKYEINQLTGVTTKEINPKNQETIYSYNDKNQLSKVEFEDKITEFNYNSTGIINRIKSGSKEYNIEYDEFNNLKKISLGNHLTFIDNTYEDKNGNIIGSTYGNGDSISYEYDEFNRMTKMNKSNKIYEFKYNNNGDLAKVITDNEIIKYDYDLTKRLNKYKNNEFTINYSYDSNDSITTKQYKIGEHENSVSNTYDNENIISSMSFENNLINYNYDKLGRLCSKKINNSYTTLCNYENNGKRATNTIKEIINGNSQIKYKYDKLGNITHIYEDGKLKNRYHYNLYNELIREDDYELFITQRYKYDLEGNIIQKKKTKLNSYEYIETVKYEYNDQNWKDKLTSFNGKNIVYDGMGNPTSIGTETTLIWKNGKELEKIVDSNNIINFEYNVAGLRKSKTVNGVKTDYYYENNKLIFEKNNNNLIYYIRNELDDLVGLKYNDKLYYYIKNAQNDIIGIIDENNNLVCKYSYDSWGNIISIKDNLGNDIINEDTHIANINPYRYRSYYYDKETRLYYLSLRYYNPQWSRFINADLILTISADCFNYNMFTYANNNPVSYDDYNGTIFKNIKKAFNKVKEAGRKVLNHCKEVASKAASVVSETVTSVCKTIKDIGKTISNTAKKISTSIGAVTSSSIMDETYSKTIMPGFTHTVGTSTTVTVGDTDKAIVFENTLDSDGGSKGVVFGGNVAIRANSSITSKSLEIGIGNSSLAVGINSMSNSVFLEINHAKSSKDDLISTSITNRFDMHPVLALGLCAVAVGLSYVSLPVAVSWGALAFAI